MTLLYDWLRKAAKAQGNNKAVVYRDNYLSWRGLLHRVDRRAQEFQSMGIKKGAWVGLMLGNVPDFVILALALSRLDAAIVPIDPTTGTRELEMILEAAPMRGLITRPREEVSHRFDDVATHDDAVGAGCGEVVEHAEEVVGLSCGPRSGRRRHAHADLVELDERHAFAALDELFEELEAGC